MLHFQRFDGKLHRHLVQAKLGELLRARHGRAGGYRKNDPDMYELLLGHQPQALEHARRLARDHGIDPHGRTAPADASPCTTVFRLVEALNAEIR